MSLPKPSSSSPKARTLGAAEDGSMQQVSPAQQPPPQWDAAALTLLGAALLGDDLVASLDASQRITTWFTLPLLQSAEGGRFVKWLVNAVQSAKEPKLYALLSTLIRKVICEDFSVRGVALLTANSSASAEEHDRSAERLNDVAATLLTFLVDAASEEDISLASDASATLRSLLENMYYNSTTETTTAGGGRLRAAIEVLQRLLRSHLKSNHLLRLFDGYEQISFSSPTASVSSHATTANQHQQHSLGSNRDDRRLDALLGFLRSVDVSEGGGTPVAQAEQEEEEGGGSALSRKRHNLLDAYLLHDVLIQAIAQDDTLMLMSVLWTSGLVLRHAHDDGDKPVEGEAAGGVGLAVAASSSYVSSSLPSWQPLMQLISSVLSDPATHSLLYSAAARAVGLACWRCADGAATVIRRGWVAALSTFAIANTLDSSLSVRNETELCAAWEALAAVCTTIKGQHVMFGSAVEGKSGGLFFGEATGNAVEAVCGPLSRRGSVSLRCAFLDFLSAALAGCGHRNPQRWLTRDAWLSLWELRHNGDEVVRRSLWRFVGTSLGADGAVANMVAPSCASHLASCEPERDVTVREQMLWSADRCLSLDSVSMFHDRLRHIVKEGLYPRSLAAAAVGEELQRR